MSVSGRMLSSVLTAPVSAVPALFVTVRARPGPFRSVKTVFSGAAPLEAVLMEQPLEEVLTERNGPVRARTVANRAGTALTGAVRTGR